MTAMLIPMLTFLKLTFSQRQKQRLARYVPDKHMSETRYALYAVAKFWQIALAFVFAVVSNLVAAVVLGVGAAALLFFALGVRLSSF